jgi:hypothetical protein
MIHSARKHICGCEDGLLAALLLYLDVHHELALRLTQDVLARVYCHFISAKLLYHSSVHCSSGSCALSCMCPGPGLTYNTPWINSFCACCTPTGWYGQSCCMHGANEGRLTTVGGFQSTWLRPQTHTCIQRDLQANRPPPLPSTRTADLLVSFGREADGYPWTTRDCCAERATCVSLALGRLLRTHLMQCCQAGRYV